MPDTISPAEPAEAETESPLPRGVVAVRLIELWRDSGRPGLLFVCRNEQAAEYLGANIADLAPDCPVLVLPRWDCLPYDPSGPSPEIMGRRSSVLRRLGEGLERPLVIATPEALLQRVPPPTTWADNVLRLRTGDCVALADLQDFLERTGYRLASLVDEPGEAALHGQTADIFPGGGLAPVRIEFDGEQVAAIQAYDPTTQRSTAQLEEIALDPASEFVGGVEADKGETDRADAADSPWLCVGHRQLATVFDYLPGATIVLDGGVADRVDLWLDQVRDTHEAARRLPDVAGAAAIPAPALLFCDKAEWQQLLAEHRIEPIAPAAIDDLRVPLFAVEADPTRRFRQFLAEQRQAGRRIVLTASDPRELKTLARRAEPETGPAQPAGTWQEVTAAAPGTALALCVDFDAGFVTPSGDTVVIAAADLLGSRARHAIPMDVTPHAEIAAEPGLRLGDAVVHVDHGIGLLRGVETVEVAGGPAQDLLRLEFAAGATLMVPMPEIGRVWRYGGDPEAVSLDRLGGEAWTKRRGEVEAEIAESAIGLLKVAAEDAAREAPKLAPPARAYERFVAGFPFVATPDQAHAVEDVLKDLRSGHPMDRLVCGDVGFGKTEVALRAAAAAALAGKQVAVVAPTTVLARQHLNTFRRRFARFGIEIGHLSRLVKPAEARAVKKGLADGSIRIVIGTQAVGGKAVRFADLGLMIIDEEQHFGTATKAKLRNFAAGVHVLTLTATPIPRTLQRALVGLQSLSVLASPPARRLPVRTVVASFEPRLVREALLYERRRGGQSFVVCPRIEDIEPLAAQLRTIVPELGLRVTHGKMPAAEIDDTMIGFAEGRSDVLLATNIIESGLDLPRANTILLWRPDRFGLAQLHQLRGRVGRGRRRGFAHLLTEPGAKLTAATEKRLKRLAEFDRLGSGFAISEQDMEMRGSGDLLGEEQAGHVRLIGVELYRHLLDRALAGAKCQAVPPDWMPELNLGVAGTIPADYVADPETRINLYARLARLETAHDIDAFSEELQDRFGELPTATANLLDLARLALIARSRGIRRIDAGPRGVALTFDEDAPRPEPAQSEPTLSGRTPAAPASARSDARSEDGRLLFDRPSTEEDRIATVLEICAQL